MEKKNDIHLEKSIPEYPGQPSPSYPGQQTPSYPGQQTPSYPGQQSPAYPGQQTPAYPGQQSPSYPGQQNLSYSGQQNLQYPGQPNLRIPGQQIQYGGQGGNTTVIFNQGNRPEESLTGAIIFSVFVYFLCNFICGMIGFILAIVGNSEANKNTRRNFKLASYTVNCIGIFITIVIIVVLCIVFSNTKNYLTQTEKNGYSHLYYKS